MLKNVFTGSPIGLSTTPWVDAVEAGIIGGLGAAAIQALDIFLGANGEIMLQQVSASITSAVSRLTYFFSAILDVIRSGTQVVSGVYLFTLGERIAALVARAGLRAGAAYDQVDLRVEPLGDSITAGYQSSDHNGYRERLYGDLRPAERRPPPRRHPT